MTLEPLVLLFDVDGTRRPTGAWSSGRWRSTAKSTVAPGYSIGVGWGDTAPNPSWATPARTGSARHRTS